jgi:osmotically-inducible protein OsmY
MTIRSTSAHNITIVAQDDKATLKGPVRLKEKKNAINARATEVARAGNVIDQLEVAPKS